MFTAVDEAYDDVSIAASSSSIGVMGTTGVRWSLFVGSSAATNVEGLLKSKNEMFQAAEIEIV